jgi:hypothetical protein
MPWERPVKGDRRGRMAKAPPPEAFQLMDRYFWRSE